ncbi:MAG: 3-hydroxyacyl-CoA dehydrogenase NAD-binding domain-containing protein, partial [Acidimicrobiales bacterium]
MATTNKVGICGSGSMGSGLAEVAAKAGYEVVVRSRSKAAAEAMLKSI